MQKTKCSFCGKGLRLKGKELKHQGKTIACSKKCQNKLKKEGIKSIDLHYVRDILKRKEG